MLDELISAKGAAKVRNKTLEESTLISSSESVQE
jgi:hypothetical protein